LFCTFETIFILEEKLAILKYFYFVSNVRNNYNSDSTDTVLVVCRLVLAWKLIVSRL